MHMQEQSKDHIYQELLKHMESTKDFVLEQAPEVIQQALKYEKIAAFVSAALMTVLLVIALGVAYYFWKNPMFDKYGSREMHSLLGIFIPILISPLFFVQFCMAIDILIKIHVAPKYFLINLILDLKK